MISAVRLANEGMKNAGDRVDKAVQNFAEGSKSARGPEVKDVIEFKTAGHAFEASAKVSKMANNMMGKLLDIVS